MPSSASPASPAQPTRFRSVGLVLAALLPLLLVAGFAMTEAMRVYRSTEEARLGDTAEIFAAGVDARLSAYAAAMTTLSLVPSLFGDDNLAGFHERAVAVGEALGGWLLLFGPGPDFALLASSRVPWGTPLPPSRSEDDERTMQHAAARAARERRPVVSDLFRNRLGGAFSISVLVPVLRDEEVTAVLAFAFETPNLRQVVPAREGASTLFGGVTDSRGRLVLHTRGEAGPPVGTPSPTWVAARIEGQQRGVTVAANVSGQASMFAFQRLTQAPGWIVFVGQTAEAQAAGVSRLFGWLVAALAALVTAAGLLAWAHRRDAFSVAAQEAAALRQGRAEVERLHGGLPALIFVREIDADGGARLLYRGGNVEAVTGYPAEALANIDNLTDLAEDRQPMAKAMEASRGFGSGSADWPMKRPDGHGVTWLRTSWRIEELRPDGSVIVIGYSINITAEREANARASAAARLASLGEMATGLAHELMQPLQAIMTGAELAQVAAQRIDATAIDARLETVIGQVLRARGIVNNLRRFARGELEGAPVQVVQVETAIENVMVLIGGLLRDAGIEVSTHLAADARAVLGHPVALEQVLTNLLINSRDALATCAAGAPRRVTLSTEASDGLVRLRVSDTGGGVPPEVVARVFEPFVTTKPPDKGTGIGLSIAHGLITGMGGTIDVMNGTDGAVFTITLPMA